MIEVNPLETLSVLAANSEQSSDVIGREVDINTKSSTLLYIYDDGTVEKKYMLE